MGVHFIKEGRVVPDGWPRRVAATIYPGLWATNVGSLTNRGAITPPGAPAKFCNYPVLTGAF